jgi:hypothetical protein
MAASMLRLIGRESVDWYTSCWNALVVRWGDMAKIFISHSSKADPFAGQVRQAVTAGLRRFEVLVDMDALKPGDEWASVLYHWLAECHAAVILLNQEALRSTWVRREVNILLWRRALGYPLKLVPAIIGGLSTKDIRDAGFGELEPFQFARIPRSAKTAEAAQMLAAQIVDRFAGLSPSALDNTPMGSWANAIASDLSEVKSLDSLVAAARELRVEEGWLDRVRDPDEGCRFVAHQLLAHGRDLRVYHAIAKIADFTPVEWLSRLIDKVGPTWVDGEAARALLAPGGRKPRTFILNARKPQTAEHYIGRATCCAQDGYTYQTVSAVAGESFVDEFVSDCRKAVGALLRIPPDWEIEDALPLPGEEPEETTFLIVHPGKTRMALVAEGVRTVQALFPWLTLVLLVGDTPPSQADLADWQLTEALVLPSLMPKEELEAQQMIWSLGELWKKVAGRLAGGVA